MFESILLFSTKIDIGLRLSCKPLVTLEKNSGGGNQMKIPKEYEKNSPFHRHLLNGFTAFAMRLMRIKVHVTGYDKVPAGAKPLFVSNHRSNFDPIVTWYIFKDWTLAFISKVENLRIPFFGYLVRKCCFMTIDREDPRKAMKTILKATELVKKEEVSIGVYPEGTRSKTCELLPFHNGVFKIAQKAHVPIVVLAITGTENIHKNFPLHRTEVYLDVLDVLPAEDIAKQNTNEIGALVWAQMKEHLDEEK